MNRGHHQNFPTLTNTTIVTIVGTPCTNGAGREYRVAEHPINALRFQYLDEEKRIVTAQTRDIVALVDAFSRSDVFSSYAEAELETWKLSADLSLPVQVAELESSWTELIIQAMELRSQGPTRDGCSS